MDKVEQYRQAIREVINYHTSYKLAQDNVETLTLYDEENGNYILMDIETKDGQREHWIVVFLRLHNDKIYVEKDGIEYGVAEDLIEAGVCREDILYDFGSFKPQKESDQAAA